MELTPAPTRFLPPWLAWLLLTGLTAGVLADRFADRPLSDTTWLLDVAERVFRGAKYGEDILEVSPPMILIIKGPVAVLGDLLGVDPLWLWYPLVAGLAWASILWTTSVLHGTALGSRLPTPVLIASLVWVGLLLPGRDFGQKDHLAGLLVLPYLAVAVRRVSGLQITAQVAALTGAIGAMGIGIKPHYVLLPAAVILLEVCRRSAHALRHPEHWCALATLLMYAGGVGLLAPGYYGFVAEYGALYQAYLPIWYSANLGWEVFPPTAAVTAYAWCRPMAAEADRQGGDVLAAAAFAFVLAALAQGKGWGYHFLPANLIAGLLLVGVLVPVLVRGGQVVRARVGRFLTTASLGSLLVSGAVRLARPSWNSADVAIAKANDNLVRTAVRGRSDPGEAVGVLSVAIEFSFPLLHRSDRPWAFRMPTMWPLVAFRRKEIHGWGPINQPHSGAAVERYLTMVCKDLVAARPRILLVVPARSQRSSVRAPYGYYVAYLSSFPPLAAVLAGYEDQGSLGGYRLLVLKSATRVRERSLTTDCSPSSP